MVHTTITFLEAAETLHSEINQEKIKYINISWNDNDDTRILVELYLFEKETS